MEGSGMPKITVTTNNGVVAEVIDAADCDISKPIAKADIADEVMQAIELALRMEANGD
jgi:hypothetical protein